VTEAVFIVDGERVCAGELARGPWDAAAQHGGAPAALIARAFERAPGGEQLALARITYELLRPVPLGELTLSTVLVRPGRRVQLLEATLRDGAGAEVVRARGLRVRPAAVERVDQPEPLPPPPEQGAPADYPFERNGLRMFAADAIELRFVEGAFAVPGAATAWFRLRVPLVAGEQPSPLQRLAAAADFPNGIASVLPWRRYRFINPELTLYIERAPAGEWICLRARMRVRSGGIGFAEAELFDRSGRVGRSCQALLIEAT
jgi:hypothetical protein